MEQGDTKPYFMYVYNIYKRANIFYYREFCSNLDE